MLHRLLKHGHMPDQAFLSPGRLRQAIQDYPEANAVLVRRHGVYVWGQDWIQAKTQAECYDYLFEAALRMHSMGINASLPPAPAPLQNGHAYASMASPLCFCQLLGV